MENVKRWFKRNKDKEVISITVEKTIPSRCSYCGYGEILVGQANIRDYNEDDENGESENEYEKKEETVDFIYKTVDFIYKTGCLSYSEEMDYE